MGNKAKKKNAALKRKRIDREELPDEITITISSNMIPDGMSRQEFIDSLLSYLIPDGMSRQEFIDSFGHEDLNILTIPERDYYTEEEGINIFNDAEREIRPDNIEIALNPLTLI